MTLRDILWPWGALREAIFGVLGGLSFLAGTVFAVAGAQFVPSVLLGFAGLIIFNCIGVFVLVRAELDLLKRAPKRDAKTGGVRGMTIRALVFASGLTIGITASWFAFAPANPPIEFDGRGSIIIRSEAAPFWAFEMPSGKNVFCDSVVADPSVSDGVMGFDDGAVYHVSFGKISFASNYDGSEDAAGPCKIYKIGGFRQRGDAQ